MVNNHEPNHQGGGQDDAPTSGSRVDHGRDGQGILPADAASTPSSQAADSEPNHHGADGANNSDIEAKVLAYIQENHLQLNLPLLFPDPREVRELKQVAPELYGEYIHAIRTSTDTDAYERRARYDIPAEYARRGQRYGLTAVMAMLVLAGVAVLAGSPLLAGVLGVVDLVALAAVFQGVTNKEPKKDVDEN